MIDVAKGVLKRLDSADEHIKHALRLLQTTAVEPALRPAGEKSKSLQDFVDEQAVEELTAAFRECIDRTTEAQSDFAGSNHGLDDEIKKIQELLSSVSLLDPNFDYPDTVSLFRALESHATETADLLQSLVRHYDLCVTALKHTEGGGEAAQEAQVDLPPALDSASPEMQLEPMSEKEREEMLHVLNKDAEEVTDVVEEIRERVTQMESQYEQIKNQERVLHENELSMLEAVSLLDVNSASLPRYVKASAIFLSRWNEIQQRIDEKLETMDSLCDFYTGFLHAYDGLLIEIGRRKSVKARIDKIIQDSLINIDSLLDDDAEERQAFRSEHGEYLPSDIWSGLGQMPPRYELRQVKNQEDEMPNLPSGIIKKAIDRTKRRGLQ